MSARFAKIVCSVSRHLIFLCATTVKEGKNVCWPCCRQSRRVPCPGGAGRCRHQRGRCVCRRHATALGRWAGGLAASGRVGLPSGVLAHERRAGRQLQRCRFRLACRFCTCLANQHGAPLLSCLQLSRGMLRLWRPCCSAEPTSKRVSCCGACLPIPAPRVAHCWPGLESPAAQLGRCWTCKGSRCDCTCAPLPCPLQS